MDNKTMNSRRVKIAVLVVVFVFALIVLATKVPYLLGPDQDSGSRPAGVSDTTERIARALASKKPVVIGILMGWLL